MPAEAKRLEKISQSKHHNERLKNGLKIRPDIIQDCVIII